MATTYRVRVYRTQETTVEVTTDGTVEDAKDSAVCDLGSYPAEWWDTVSVEADVTEVGFRDLPGLASA